MKITCDKHILHNVYEYDFKSSSYNILKNVMYDVSDIPFENKECRNIKIGILQRNNRMLSSYVYNTAKNLCDFYIDKNNVRNHIICRQRDGFVSSKKLTYIKDTSPIDLRTTYSTMLVPFLKTSYLGVTISGNVVVKGVPYLPVDISFYNMFKNIRFGKNIYRYLESIRINILTAKNIMWFIIKKGDKLLLPLINGKTILVANLDQAKYIDPNDIQKDLLWEYYIWPFVQPLCT